MKKNLSLYEIIEKWKQEIKKDQEERASRDYNLKDLLNQKTMKRQINQLKAEEPEIFNIEEQNEYKLSLYLESFFENLRKENPERFNKILFCGSRSCIIRHRENQKVYIIPATCNDPLCPTCRARDIKVLKEKIENYVKQNNMVFFTTLTTRDLTVEELEKTYDSIIKTIKRINKSFYLEENKNKIKTSTGLPYTDEEKETMYQNYIESLIQDEIKFQFYLNYYKSIIFDIIKYIQETESDDPKAYKKIKPSERKNVFEYKKTTFKAMTDEQRRKFMTEEFKNTFNENFNAMYKNFINGYRNFEVYEKNEETKKYEVVEELSYGYFYTKIQGQIQLNIEEEFCCIKATEKQHNDGEFLHYHILSNFPFLKHLIADKTEKTKDTKVYDSRDIRESEITGDKTKDPLVKSARYLTKYITKDFFLYQDTEEDETSQESLKRQVSSTQNIELFEKKKKDYEFISYKHRMPPASMTEIPAGVDIEKYLQNLPQSSPILEHPNPFFSERGEVIFNHLKKIEEVKAEYKNKRKKKDLQERDERLKQLNEDHTARMNKINTMCLLSEMERIKNVEPVVLQCNEKYEFVKDQRTLNLLQRKFFEVLIQQDTKYLLFTGSAGTGKTTALEHLEGYLKNTNIKYGSLAGKAVARIKESIENGENAKTIHRHLGAKFSKYGSFSRTAKNPLDCDLFIIDEVSMIPKFLLAALLSALRPDCKIVLIGDRKQLQPINSSSLIDLFISLEKDNEYKIKTIELTDIFRNGSKVRTVLDTILSREVEKIPFQNFDLDKIVKYSRNGYRILANTRAMTEKINIAISETKNEKEGVYLRPYRYYEKQEVLILENDIINSVFNGDLVHIEKIDKNEKRIYMKNSEGNIFSYSFLECFSKITYSDCLTIHKSQGSEFEKVLCVFENSGYLLNNNIIYTGASRAKKEVHFISEPLEKLEVFNKTQENQDIYTTFSDILAEYQEKKNQFDTDYFNI